jgi:hypothetical protein
MAFVRRADQDRLSEEKSHWRRPASREPSDAYFDGEPLPRDTAPRHWLLEGDVHQVRKVGRSDNTRYLVGPQVTVLRDDMRRLTWAAVEENGRVVLTKYAQPAATASELARETVAEGDIRRFHIALNKYTGRVSTTWVAAQGSELWHDGSRVETSESGLDFPFFAYSQVPIGLIQVEEPAYGVLGYKSRDSGRVYIRRVEGSDVGPEQAIAEGEETVGGVSFGVTGDDVLARVDLVRDGKIVPALVESSDGGRSFGKPRPIDLSQVDREFVVRPGFQRPIVDKGGAFHVPIGMESESEALTLNNAISGDLLVEAIRVDGRLRKGDLEVFPSTLGSGNTFGNGVSDGHGLIMALSTEQGYLFTSNSSAGGSHFPHSHLMNHEFPLVADYSASECYSSGLIPNVVSMDYLFVEANHVGRPVSSDVYIETWDMPLPEPRARAKADGGTVRVEILNDADLEPGKVTFGFDDPTVNITGVDIHDLRNATVTTDASDLDGRVLTFDVLTLFHRHYGETTVGAGDAEA